jgi:hypothetical protein
VLVWINGPFGGGKTATAFELQRRLPGSIVCDPEHLGFALHRMLPPALRTNFQDLQAKQTVPQVADAIARIAALPIIPDTDGRVRASLRRYATTVRHIRFD